MYGQTRQKCSKSYLSALCIITKTFINVFFSLSSIQDYTKGELLTGFLKKELIDVLTPIVTAHQEARKTITDEMVKEYMRPRPLNF